MAVVSSKKGYEFGGGARVTVAARELERSLYGTLAVLKEFAPDLVKELNDEIRAAMKEVAATASMRFPTGPGRWGDGHGKDGFRVKKSKAKIGYSAINSVKSAVITEFAGKVNPGGLKPRGASLIRTLNAEYGSPGRFLWSTWDDLADYEIMRIKDRAKELEATYTQRLASRGAVA